MMEAEFNAPACEQADNLIALLYGELNIEETQIFQRHMQGCKSCSGEFAAFSGIRRSVVAWREESLSSISAPAAPYFAAPNATAAGIREKPSALAALREFLDLSPLWMKGALAFATVLFVIFTGLALASLRTTPTPPRAINSEKSDRKAYSDQELNALVEQRVQDELQRIKISAPAPPQQLVLDHQSQEGSNRRLATRSNEVAKISPARRPLSRTERAQLAADLRLLSFNTESELELLDDTINQ